jgi:hypothetical protein
VAQAFVGQMEPKLGGYHQGQSAACASPPADRAMRVGRHSHGSNSRHGNVLEGAFGQLLCSKPKLSAMYDGRTSLVLERERLLLGSNNISGCGVIFTAALRTVLACDLCGQMVSPFETVQCLCILVLLRPCIVYSSPRSGYVISFPWGHPILAAFSRLHCQA